MLRIIQSLNAFQALTIMSHSQNEHSILRKAKYLYKSKSFSFTTQIHWSLHLCQQKFMFINKLTTALLQNKAFDYTAVIHKPDLKH